MKFFILFILVFSALAQASDENVRCTLSEPDGTRTVSEEAFKNYTQVVMTGKSYIASVTSDGRHLEVQVFKTKNTYERIFESSFFDFSIDRVSTFNKISVEGGTLDLICLTTPRM